MSKRYQLAELENKYDALKASHTKLVEAFEQIVRTHTSIQKYNDASNANNMFQIAKQALAEAEKI